MSATDTSLLCRRLALFTFLVSAAAVWAAATPDLDGAAWIWSADAPAMMAPEGKRYFRCQFTLPPGAEGAMAHISATADNLLTVFLNGTAVCGRETDPDAWNQPVAAQANGLLLPGANCVAVVATNTAPGPAGLILKLSVATGTGTPFVVVTNATWRCADRAAPGWMRPGFDDSDWPAVTVLGEFGMAPWGSMGLPHTDTPTVDFSESKWVWTAEAAPPYSPPAGARYFRASFRVPATGAGVRGQALITADNAFALYVNGRRIGRGTEWSQPRRFDITAALVPGDNVIAVRALNTLDGPAGLLVKVVVTQPGQPTVVRVTDGSWVWSREGPAGWQQPDFDDSGWQSVHVQGEANMAPWGGNLQLPPPVLAQLSGPVTRLTDPTDPVWTSPVVLVQGLLMVSARGENFIQNISGTRAFTEFDTACPAAVGRRLVALPMLRPGEKARVLCDAGDGWLGSPAVSYDGRTVYFAMAPEGEAYFHLFAVGTDGSGLRQLTRGAFHDFDPQELPDGRLVFSSTRRGSCEEYHGVPAFSLFTCDLRGGDVQPLTGHIVGDREPRVMADGSLVFVRCDNFAERAKVETHIHHTRLDGTGGSLIIGPDRGSISWDPTTGGESGMAWLRFFGAGVPAPLPAGGLAAISEQGLVVSGDQRGRSRGGYLPYDFCALPDGRLLCTDRDNWRLCVLDLQTGQAAEILDGDALDLPTDAPAADPAFIPDALHSVTYAGPRPRPPVTPVTTPPPPADGRVATGYLYCQNVFNTRHTAADVSRIRAVRIYEGRPFTLTPTRSIYVHIGTEGRELGTVPVARDGSFAAEVPADRALSLQAVDAEGRAVINELSWIYVRPGERRSCVGCHAPAGSAPPPARVEAVRGRPLRLVDDAEPHRYRVNNAANGGVLNLQFERFREAGSINLYRQGPLAGGAPLVALPPGRPSEVAALVEQTRAAVAAARIAAAQRLAVLRDRSATPALVSLLRDPVAEVRNAANVGLAACGDQRALGPLCEALGDAHPTVARGAEVALQHLTGHIATAGGPVGWRAWLADLDLQEHERSLCETLMAGGRLEALAAAEALGHLGGQAAAAALSAYLKEHPDGELRMLMAVMRALGHVGNGAAVPQLERLLRDNLAPVEGTGDREAGFWQRPVYLAATAAEALGWIGGPHAERALLAALGELADFAQYTLHCGDHPWLVGCHSSPVHYRVLEALDALGSVNTGPLVPAILRSVPMDKDRALLFEPDSYEALTSRVVQRSGRAGEVVETCLWWLGDPQAVAAPDLVAAVSESPHAEAHIRPHTPAARAAQILCVTCLDPAWGPRIQARAQDYVNRPDSEERSWVCFFLLRALGHLRAPQGATVARDVLTGQPTEASFGYCPPPDHWVFRAMSPFFRAAAAFALGQTGDPADVPLLMRLMDDFGNAPAVRDQAAVALGKLATQDQLPALQQLATGYPEFAIRRSLQEACDRVSSGGGR